MQDVTLSAPARAVDDVAGVAGDRFYVRRIAAVILLLTLVRLVWMAVQSAGLYSDEAQYWLWGQHPAWGYYSKPPVVAWLIAATTGIFGDSEFAIRLAAPLLHALTAAAVFGIGRRLYDARTGFWGALGYLTLPGVSLSAFIISTDAPLLLCWTMALYAFIRARQDETLSWWLAVGIAAGFGLLSKYAMAYWLISALGFVLLIRQERRHLKPLLAAIAIAVLIYLPNLLWNWGNGFVSYLHTRDNAELHGFLLHPKAFLEFLASQFGVFGPLFFGALIAIAVSARTLREPRARLLAVFTLPTLVMMLCLSFMSRAQPNWAAPAYVSATVLVVAWALRRDWTGFLAVSVAVNLAAAAIVFGVTDALAAIGIEIPAKYDPLHRLRGWPEVGRQVSDLLAAHPGLTLLADDRELLASLTYYVRPHPFGAVEWNPIPGITDHWRLTNNIGKHRGEDFLAVTVTGLIDEMRPDFTEIVPLGTIRAQSGPRGGTVYHVYIARGFRGDGRTKR